MKPDELRKLATMLREEDARVKDARNIKMAHIVRASAGLAMLKRKLGVV